MTLPNLSSKAGLRSLAVVPLRSGPYAHLISISLLALGLLYSHRTRRQVHSFLLLNPTSLSSSAQYFPELNFSVKFTIAYMACGRYTFIEDIQLTLF